MARPDWGTLMAESDGMLSNKWCLIDNQHQQRVGASAPGGVSSRHQPGSQISRNPLLCSGASVQFSSTGVRSRGHRVAASAADDRRSHAEALAGN